MRGVGRLIILAAAAFLVGLPVGNSSEEEETVKGLRCGVPLFQRYGAPGWVDEIYLPEQGVTLTTGYPLGGTRAVRGKSQMVEIWEALGKIPHPEDTPPTASFQVEEIRVPKKLAKEIDALADLQAKADAEARRISQAVRDAGLLPPPAGAGK